MLLSTLQALGALKQNTLILQTKSIEQILLVIITSKLRLLKQRCLRPFLLAFLDTYMLPTFSATIPMSMFKGTRLYVIRDSITPIVFRVNSQRCATTIDNRVNIQIEVILLVRVKVSIQIGIVHTILLYKSIE